MVRVRVARVPARPGPRSDADGRRHRHRGGARPRLPRRLPARAARLPREGPATPALLSAAPDSTDDLRHPAGDDTLPLPHRWDRRRRDRSQPRADAPARDLRAPALRRADQREPRVGGPRARRHAPRGRAPGHRPAGAARSPDRGAPGPRQHGRELRADLPPLGRGLANARRRPLLRGLRRRDAPHLLGGRDGRDLHGRGAGRPRAGAPPRAPDADGLPSRPSGLTRVEASSIAIDVSASQFPQLPVPRHSPEQVGGYRATSAWLERYPLSQHTVLQEYARDWFSGGQRNYSTVSRDPRHRL